MPDVHLRHLDDREPQAAVIAGATAAGVGRRWHAPWKLLLEVVLISAGVFLGLAGEQWRESRRHHALAHAALQRFRTEVADNQKAVAHVKDYHVRLRTALKAYFKAVPPERKNVHVSREGVQPAQFETSAWDLAISTQSLGDLPQDLALDISRVYRAQQSYTELS